MSLHPDEYFCANRDCVLHVRVGDANVIGSGGNWAEIDGLIFDRERMNPEGPHYCHKCRASLAALQSEGE